MQQFDSFAQMQRDAERRVMEMQKRAMAAVEPEPPAPAPPTAPSETPETPMNTATPIEAQIQSILSSFKLTPAESEQALVMMILMLMLREQADHRLILALMYILMGSEG